MKYDIEARRIASKNPISWIGDLEDDCTARWAGFTLRAKEMEDEVWWWAVYDDESGIVIDASYDHQITQRTGEAARQAAENGAKLYLETLN